MSEPGSRTLLFVRHGQMRLRASEAADLPTLDRFFNQELEAGLSERGRREAARVAAYFRRRPVDAVYSSTMLRATETARATADGLGLPVRALDDLRELRTGTLDPKSPPARLAAALLSSSLPAPIRRPLLGLTLIPAYHRAWKARRTTGGESPAELHARIAAALARIRREQPPHARVAIFAHGFLIRSVLRDHVGGLSARVRLARRPFLPNGCITELREDGGALRVVRFADADHLR